MFSNFLQTVLQKLIAQGKKDGMIRDAELRSHLEDMDLSPEKIEEIYDHFDSLNIQVVSEDLDLLEQVASRETAAQLRRAVEENLTDQEQQVIRLRYGLDGCPPLRQREVAQKTGISRSYVSRIEKRALEKLKQALEQ